MIKRIIIVICLLLSASIVIATETRWSINNVFYAKNDQGSCAQIAAQNQELLLLILNHFESNEIEFMTGNMVDQTGCIIGETKRAEAGELKQTFTKNSQAEINKQKIEKPKSC